MQFWLFLHFVLQAVHLVLDLVIRWLADGPGLFSMSPATSSSRVSQVGLFRVEYGFIIVSRLFSVVPKIWDGINVWSLMLGLNCQRGFCLWNSTFNACSSRGLGSIFSIDF